MLVWKEKEAGILEVTLDLEKLYPERKDRRKFEYRLKEFLSSDKENYKVFRKKGNTLRYLSEEIIPKKKDTRPALLLVFGNPAPHSVTGGMYFAHEAGGREHRVWKVFKETGIIDLAGKGNEEKKNAILTLMHASHYRVGLAVFYSAPSTPSKPPWTGVAGLRKLFGKKAFDTLTLEERKRMEAVIRRFRPQKIVVFQKDAYEALREFECHKAPPTRLLQGRKAKAELQKILKE